MNRAGKDIVYRAIGVVGLLLSLLPAGCASTRPQPSRVVQAAEEASRKGIAAEANGKPRAALAAFTVALNGYAAIEDQPGVALTLLNLARVERRLGEYGDATAHLARAQGLPLTEPTLVAEIAFEQALLLLARQEPDAAQPWAQRALAAAPKEQRGRAHNLVGRILLLRGERGPAREEARRALAELGGGELAERANGQRLLGEIALAEGDVDTGAAAFTNALALDKEAGLSSRIAADLRGLARAATLRREPPAALDFLQRAFTVAGAAGDYPLAIELLTELADLYRSGGDTAAAQRLEEERQRLIRLGGSGAPPVTTKP